MKHLRFTPGAANRDTSKRFGKIRSFCCGHGNPDIGGCFPFPAILTSRSQGKAGHGFTTFPWDAVVVLTTGAEYYPRLIEAATDLSKRFCKTDHYQWKSKNRYVIRKLEDMGFEPACHWCEDHLRILSLFDVPQTRFNASVPKMLMIR